MDMLPVFPEINALQAGMRKKSGAFIRDAEKMGFSEDVCTYVKCDIGTVSYTHLRAHETVLDIVCRLLLEKKKYN